MHKEIVLHKEKLESKTKSQSIHQKNVLTNLDSFYKSFLENGGIPRKS